MRIPGVEDQISKQMRGRVPGLSVGVAKPEGIIWEKGLGLADIATGAAAAPETVFNWFSMTKIVTATCVAPLSEHGVLNLDDPVANYYPPFSALRPTARARTVTVRHLLSHSSGLANPIPIRWIHLADEPPPDSRIFLSNLLARNPTLRFPPGMRASYSNLGYLILGEVIASVSGRSFQDYVREEILDPLSMGQTGFAHTPEMSMQAATGYQKLLSLMTPLLWFMVPHRFFGRRVGAFISLNRFYPDGAPYGGLVGSLEDAARFLQAHLRGGEINGRRLLAPESIGAMRQITALGRPRDFGLGWFRPHSANQSESEFVEHLGGGAGFWSCMRLYPDSSLGVVMMGNSTSYNHDAIARTLAAHSWNQ